MAWGLHRHASEVSGVYGLAWRWLVDRATSLLRARPVADYVALRPGPELAAGAYKARSIPVPGHGDSAKLHAALKGVIVFIPNRRGGLVLRLARL